MEARPCSATDLLLGLLCSEDVDILSQLRSLSLKGGLAPGALCLGCRCSWRGALGDILAALACEEAAQKAQRHISSLRGMTHSREILFLLYKTQRSESLHYCHCPTLTAAYCQHMHSGLLGCLL